MPWSHPKPKIQWSELFQNAVLCSMIPGAFFVFGGMLIISLDSLWAMFTAGTLSLGRLASMIPGALVLLWVVGAVFGGGAAVVGLIVGVPIAMSLYLALRWLQQLAVAYFAVLTALLVGLIFAAHALSSASDMTKIVLLTAYALIGALTGYIFAKRMQRVDAELGYNW
jgi:hypothetical protein